MARPRKETVQVINEKAREEVEEASSSLENMPLTSLREYRLYNEAAREINKKLGYVRYPIKQCPVELHPMKRIRIGRNDNSNNIISVYLSNHLIHYDEKLKPGNEYDIPECVVNYLSTKGYPVWGWVKNAKGEPETVVVGKKPRFSINEVFTGTEDY